MYIHLYMCTHTPTCNNCKEGKEKIYINISFPFFQLLQVGVCMCMCVYFFLSRKNIYIFICVCIYNFLFLSFNIYISFPLFQLLQVGVFKQRCDMNLVSISFEAIVTHVCFAFLLVSFCLCNCVSEKKLDVKTLDSVIRAGKCF